MLSLLFTSRSLDIKVTVYHVSLVSNFPVSGSWTISSWSQSPRPKEKAPSICPMSTSGFREAPVSARMSDLRICSQISECNFYKLKIWVNVNCCLINVSHQKLSSKSYHGKWSISEASFLRIYIFRINDGYPLIWMLF